MLWKVQAFFMTLESVSVCPYMHSVRSSSLFLNLSFLKSVKYYTGLCTIAP